MINTFYIKKGDTYPNMLVQLLDENNLPVDLTNATVTCRIQSNTGTGTVIERTATVVMPQVGSNKGQCYHTFIPTDTQNVGNFKVEWRVVFPSGQTATFPRGAGSSDSSNLVVQKTLA